MGSPQNRKDFHLFHNVYFEGSNAAPKGQVHEGMSTWTLRQPQQEFRTQVTRAGDYFAEKQRFRGHRQHEIEPEVIELHCCQRVPLPCRRHQMFSLNTYNIPTIEGL